MNVSIMNVSIMDVSIMDVSNMNVSNMNVSKIHVPIMVGSTNLLRNNNFWVMYKIPW